MYTLKPYTLALKEISPIKFSAVTTQPVEFDAMPALSLMDISINTGWVFTACLRSTVQCTEKQVSVYEHSDIILLIHSL